MENMNFLLLALWLLFFADKVNATTDPNSEIPDPTAGVQRDSSLKELDIYLLIGQSNMAGRAEIGVEDLDSLDQVFLFNGSTWEKANNPLNKYSTVRKNLEMQQLGPGYSFGKSLAEKSGRSIGLVVNARGGTSINQWQKGYLGEDDFDLYEKTIDQLAKVKNRRSIKGIIWHQGESDQSNPEEYMALLKQLVNDLRGELGEAVPFIAGEIGQWRKNSTEINAVIREIPKEIKHAYFVSSDGLTPLKGDRTDPHFDTPSQRILGERYAEKAFDIIYNPSIINGPI
jgi:hypothetical protein